MLPLLKWFNMKILLCRSRHAFKYLLTLSVGWKFTTGPGEVWRGEVGAAGERKPCCCQPERLRVLRLSKHQTSDLETFSASKSGDVYLFTLGTEGWWTCKSWRCSPCCSRSSRCCATTSSARCLERARLEMCPPCPENRILYDIYDMYIYAPLVLRTKCNLDIFWAFLVLRTNCNSRKFHWMAPLPPPLPGLCHNGADHRKPHHLQPRVVVMFMFICLCLSLCVYLCVYVYLCGNPKMGWIVTSSKSVVFRAVCALPVIVT